MYNLGKSIMVNSFHNNFTNFTGKGFGIGLYINKDCILTVKLLNESCDRMDEIQAKVKL